VDDSGNLNSFALRAQEKGIIFDVGHGGGSFTFKQGVNAIEQGLKPNSISTDLHIGSMNGGMKDQLNVMSKFLNMGMNMQEVIERSTWNPAQIINRNDLGHLSVGAEADLAVLDLMEGAFGFIDVDGYRLDGTRKLECELTVKGGQVMWDLNGISRPHWTEQ
jgi:dihydroorotase